MSRGAVYIMAAIVGGVLFAAAKAFAPHAGIGGEYLFLWMPFYVFMLELALLGRDDV